MGLIQVEDTLYLKLANLTVQLISFVFSTIKVKKDWGNYFIEIILIIFFLATLGLILPYIKLYLDNFFKVMFQTAIKQHPQFLVGKILSSLLLL